MKDEEETFTSILHTIAEKTISKTSAVPRKLNKPWWTEECQEVYNNRKKVLNNFKKHPTTEKLNIYKIEQVRARRVFRENMKNTWRKKVSKLNDRTPITKIWDMIRKITGKGQTNSIKHIVKDGVNITDCEAHQQYNSGNHLYKFIIC